jgi:DNA-binding NarL/FixJ family response regulator
MNAAVGLSGTLSRCQALVVAHGEQHTGMMLRLCRSVGFGEATDLSELAFASIEQNRVIYILMHYDLGDGAKEKLLATLRRVERPEISFAPVVLFMPDIPYDDMLKYIEMGFDDVVCLPEKIDVLHNRLEKQLNSDQVYVRTDTYFGPDRRRMEVAGNSHHQRTGTTEFTKTVIRRVPGDGVKVISRQLIVRGRPVESATPRS